MSISFDCFNITAPLVEIMRKEVDMPLEVTGEFSGPWPSSDSCVAIDAMARMGLSVAAFGAVGDDGFGRCVCSAMHQDGVCTDYITIRQTLPTAAAFNAEFSDATREFVHHVRGTAAGSLTKEDLDPDVIQNAKSMEISGFAMSISDTIAEAVDYALSLLPKDVPVIFDPNYRSNVLSREKMRQLTSHVIDRCDILLASEGEASIYCPGLSDDEACLAIMKHGKTVIRKTGDKGCTVYEKGVVTEVPAYRVKPLYLTCAGDCFCGAFTAAYLRGKSAAEAADFACAASAVAICKPGLMKGATLQEVEQFLLSYKSAE